MIFNSPWLPEIFRRIFTALPDDPIWKWAETAVFLSGKQTASGGYYQSARTPWTRDVQELYRNPYRNGRRIRRYGARKSSQSGFTEAFLNLIRWVAKHKPCNVIYSIDSQKEVTNIRERLLPTLLALGQQLFTGDDDDLSRYTLRLAGMDIWFTGSFSAGGFSNKFSPLVLNDEVDLYGEISAEGDTIENYWTRAKTDDRGFQGVISKPGLADGPIDSFFKRGNQEWWNVPCPHHGCRSVQTLEWDRVIFGHCKDLTGAWDYDRMLGETFYRCKDCGGEIRDHHKPEMNESGRFIATAKGEPEIVTQQMSDLFSMYPSSTLGHLAIEFVRATSSGNRKLLQSFRQQRLGLPWEEKVQRIESPDVLKLRAPYRRGTIPQEKCVVILAMDIGQYVNTRWLVYAFNMAGELWLIDWGMGEGPREALTQLRDKRYYCLPTGSRQPILFGALDARYRTDEVYETCMLAPRQLYPVMGIKSTTGARSVDYRQIPNKPLGFGLLTFLDRDAKFDLYMDRIKELKPPRIYWPEDVDEIIVREHCAERLIHHKRTGQVIWEDDHKRPNHSGDCTKIAITLVDWMLKARRARILADVAPPPSATPGEIPAPDPDI